MTQLTCHGGRWYVEPLGAEMPPRSGAALGSAALRAALGCRARKRVLEASEHFRPAELRPLTRRIAPRPGGVETGVLENEARAVAVRFESDGHPPQLTAFFTSAPILASPAAVSSFSAKAVGHRAPSSRFAASLKPNVAYLVLNFCALWKKQTTLPSLAYAGIPYQSCGERAGALALMMAWSRLPMARSRSGIAAIFASTALSPSALSARGPP